VATTLRRLAEWVIDHWAVASTVLAVVAAAIARIAYAQYYGAFDLSPEEAGVDTTRVLAGSVPGVVLAVLLLSVCVAVLATPLLAVQDATRARIDHGPHGRQRTRDLVVFIIACPIPVLVAYYVTVHAGDLLLRAPVDEFEDPIYVAAAVAAVSGALGALAGVTPWTVVLAFRNWRRKVRPVVALTGRSYLLTAVLAVPSFLALVFLLLPVAARSRAGDILAGQPVGSVTVFGAPALDVHAPRVRLLKAPTELDTTACYTLIATSDSGITLYAPDVDRIYRVPRDELIVSAGLLGDC
jgi:hypothetical protein